MITIALISEISRRLRACLKPGIAAYLFCQSTSSDLNNAVAILRDLIYQLVVQREPLLHILQERYKEAETCLSEGPNVLYALFSILKWLVQASSQPRVHLMIDAIDECDFGLDQLLYLVFHIEMSPMLEVKWLMTSRNETFIKKAIITKYHLFTSLELNSDHVF